MMIVNRCRSTARPNDGPDARAELLPEQIATVAVGNTLKASEIQKVVSRQQPAKPVVDDVVTVVTGGEAKFAKRPLHVCAKHRLFLSEAAPDHASAVPKTVCELGPATFPSCKNFAQIASIV